MIDLKQRIFDAAKELQLINIATVTEDGKPWVRYVMAKADSNLDRAFGGQACVRASIANCDYCSLSKLLL